MFFKNKDGDSLFNECIGCYNKDQDSYRKQCTKCLEIRLISDFYADPTRVDGVHDNCKICKSEYAKERHKNKPKKTCEFCGITVTQKYYTKHLKTKKCMKKQNICK
jgi:hypothetical protein